MQETLGEMRPLSRVEMPLFRNVVLGLSADSIHVSCRRTQAEQIHGKKRKWYYCIWWGCLCFVWWNKPAIPLSRTQLRCQDSRHLIACKFLDPTRPIPITHSQPIFQNTQCRGACPTNSVERQVIARRGDWVSLALWRPPVEPPRTWPRESDTTEGTWGTGVAFQRCYVASWPAGEFSNCNNWQRFSTHSGLRGSELAGSEATQTIIYSSALNKGAPKLRLRVDVFGRCSYRNDLWKPTLECVVSWRNDEFSMIIDRKRAFTSWLVALDF